MVEDTRATTSPGAIRALNEPQTTGVNTDSSGISEKIQLRGYWVAVDRITDRWRIDDEWWREQPISRMYYQCLVDQRITVTIFHDLISRLWYLQRM